MPVAGKEEPLETARKSLRLGLSTESLRHAFASKEPRRRRDIWWLIDGLPGLGLEGIEIAPGHFLGDESGFLDRLEAVVKPRGLYVEFATAGWDVSRLATRIQLTARFGGRAVRTSLGPGASSGAEVLRYIELAAPALRHAAGLADALRVDIAVEGQGSLGTKELKELLDRVGHPRVGACFDTGDPILRGEDAFESARILGPLTRAVHLKDWTVRRGADEGATWVEAVPGRGQVPLLEILRVIVGYRSALDVSLDVPVQPSADEAETVAREWRHVRESGAAARKLLEAL